MTTFEMLQLPAETVDPKTFRQGVMTVAAAHMDISTEVVFETSDHGLDWFDASPTRYSKKELSALGMGVGPAVGRYFGVAVGERLARLVMELMEVRKHRKVTFRIGIPMMRKCKVRGDAMDLAMTIKYSVVADGERVPYDKKMQADAEKHSDKPTSNPKIELN